MNVLYPGSRKKVWEETKKLLIKKLIISLAAAAFLIAFDFSTYWIILTLMLVILINGVYEAYVYSRMNIKLLERFEDFLNDLVFQYRYCGSIEEALQDTIMNTSPDMSLHGNLIYELITGDDYEEALEYYKTVSPNSYFLMFFSICYMVKAEGDKSEAGESVFINNLNMLISDINDEINLSKKTDNAFSGLFMVTLLPVFMMKPMEMWAVSNVPGLASHYGSNAGIAGTLVISFFSIGICAAVKKMKYPYIPARSKSRLIETLTYGRDENGAYAGLVASIQNMMINRSYQKYRRLSILLKKTCSDMNVREFKIKQLLYSALCAAALPAVTSNITFPWYIRAAELVLGGIAGYWIPMLSMAFSYESVKNSIMSEVIRLQAIVSMCIYQDGIDVRGILSHMEMVSVYFKNAVSCAVNSYDGDGMQALEELKSKEYNKSFLRLVDGMIACDVLPIDQAFANIGKERDFDIQKKKLEDDKALNNKSAIAKFAAYIPMFASVTIKLILPFIMEGLNSLMAFSSEFQM